MGSFLSLCLLFLPSPYCPVFSQVILHTPLKLLLNRSLPCLLSLLCSYLNKQKGGSSSPHWRNHWFSNSAFLGCTIFQQGCWSGVESKIYFFYFLNSFEKKKKKKCSRSSRADLGEAPLAVKHPALYSCLTLHLPSLFLFFETSGGSLKEAPPGPVGTPKMAPLPVLKAHLPEFLRGKIEAMMMYILDCKQNGDISRLCLWKIQSGETGGYISHIRCS